MRLTCPNCSARYEVDESMIPATGRDVQCSNCSSTWFQPGPRAEEPSIDEPMDQEVPDAGTIDAPEESAEAQLSEVNIDGPSGVAGEEVDEDTPPRPPRRQIDSAVTDILRQEAEREAQLRRAEAAPEPEPVETQDEMSLESASETARMRRLAELDDAQDAFDTAQIEAAVATAAAASRRELLPDIEEINSTLRATGDRAEGEEDATDVETVGSTARRRSQTRRSFFLVLFIAVLAVVLYVYSSQIGEAVPALAPYLENYVTSVNNARFWLDDMARSLAGEAE